MDDLDALFTGEDQDKDDVLDELKDKDDITQDDSEEDVFETIQQNIGGVVEEVVSKALEDKLKPILEQFGESQQVIKELASILQDKGDDDKHTDEGTKEIESLKKQVEVISMSKQIDEVAEQVPAIKPYKKHILEEMLKGKSLEEAMKVSLFEPVLKGYETSQKELKKLKEAKVPFMEGSGNFSFLDTGKKKEHDEYNKRLVESLKSLSSGFPLEEG